MTRSQGPAAPNASATFAYSSNEMAVGAECHVVDGDDVERLHAQGPNLPSARSVKEFHLSHAFEEPAACRGNRVSVRAEGHLIPYLDKDSILVIARITSKVTSKLQVTIPKAVANRFGIQLGDELEWVEAGDTIRVELAGRPSLSKASVEERLRWFDQATVRQQARETNRSEVVTNQDRGWTREELYERGSVG